MTDGELQEQLQFSSLEAAPQVQDPPLMVALLCGGPLAGQAQSLTSAQMFLQQLQTHNPREGFQGDPVASAASFPSPADLANPSSSSSSDQSEATSSLSVSPSLPTAKRDDLTGIHFVPIFITSEGHAMPITAAELCGKSAATLQFEAGLNGRQIVNLEQLGLQLQGMADVALSTVQGGRAHVIQEALQAVGLPVVGPTSQAHNIVSHRMR